MAGGSVASGDVKGFDADLIRDGDLHDVDGCCGGGLGVYGAFEEGGEPGIGFNGEDAAAGACFLCGGDGEEADVGADVPDGVGGVDELAG